MSDHPDDLGFELPPPAKTARWKVVAVLGILAGGAFGFGYIQHRKARGEVPIQGDKVTRVDVIKAKILLTDHGLTLPGTVRPLEETKLFPHITGYVRNWNVDLGDHVTAGQLLAEIATPDLDAQLGQGRAQLAQATAALKQAIAQRNYSSSNSKRYEGLADQNLVAKGQVEQTQAQAANDEAAVNAAQANIAAQQANVRRLVELQGYAKITAPFAGTVTTRNIDRGALVTDGTTVVPLFTIAATDPVRIFVDVPQSVAPNLKSGTDAAITVREFGARVFPGKIARSAGALDPDLHTMNAEIRVPNGDGALLPGMYVQVAITLPAPHKVLEVPATALYSDAAGVRVAVVDAHGKVHYTPITIERDTGATLHVGSGLTGEEQIVKIAVPTLAEGDVVEIAK